MTIKDKFDKSTVISKTVNAIATKGIYDYDILDTDGTPLYGVIGNGLGIIIYDYTLDCDAAKRWGAEDDFEIKSAQKKVEKLLKRWLSDLPDIITIHATPDDSVEADAIDWEVL